MWKVRQTLPEVVRPRGVVDVIVVIVVRDVVVDVVVVDLSRCDDSTFRHTRGVAGVRRLSWRRNI